MRHSIAITRCLLLFVLVFGIAGSCLAGDPLQCRTREVLLEVALLESPIKVVGRVSDALEDSLSRLIGQLLVCWVQSFLDLGFSGVLLFGNCWRLVGNCSSNSIAVLARYLDSMDSLRFCSAPEAPFCLVEVLLRSSEIVSGSWNSLRFCYGLLPFLVFSSSLSCLFCFQSTWGSWCDSWDSGGGLSTFGFIWGWLEVSLMASEVQGDC